MHHMLFNEECLVGVRCPLVGVRVPRRTHLRKVVLLPMRTHLRMAMLLPRRTHLVMIGAHVTRLMLDTP